MFWVRKKECGGGWKAKEAKCKVREERSEVSKHFSFPIASSPLSHPIHLPRGVKSRRGYMGLSPVSEETARIKLQAAGGQVINSTRQNSAGKKSELRTSLKMRFESE